MKQIITLITLLVFLFSGISYSQQPLKKVEKETISKNQTDKIVHPTVIKKPAAFAISGPLNKLNLMESDIKFLNNSFLMDLI